MRGGYFPNPMEVPTTQLRLCDLPAGSGDRVLRQVASWLLPGAGDVDALADTHQAEQLVAMAESERLLGPLLVAVDGGGLELPDDLVAKVLAGHESSMLWCLHLEVRLLEIMDWFDEVGGIKFLVVKRPAVAHLDDADPSLRSFADLDLLISGADMDRALRVLTDHGAERRIPERRPGYDRRFGKGTGLVCADQVEIDVHRTLAMGAHGVRIPLDDLFARSVSFDVGGRSVPAPCLVHRALHAAYHAVIGTPVPALRSLRDLAGYLTSPDLSLEELVSEARRWRGEAVLVEALRATFDGLSFEAPEWRQWLDSVAPDQRELAIIESTHYETTRPVRWSTLRELRWSDRGAFLWAVAFPSSEDLASRGLTRRGRIVSGLGSALRRFRARFRRV